MPKSAMAGLDNTTHLAIFRRSGAGSTPFVAAERPHPLGHRSRHPVHDYPPGMRFVQSTIRPRQARRRPARMLGIIRNKRACTRPRHMKD
ncbi:hypothetical protein GCM10023144_16910 [Pigmentiphaga soli]|uniref:Uncharacterized protein n=1 Tax=Pigmentiphaga soli TaxID=1007095 RepID=A0ABP8GU75_9BURK